MLFTCTGTVVSNFGDSWTIILALSDIIPYDLVYSGKQIYSVSVRIVAVPAGVVTGREHGGLLG